MNGARQLLFTLFAFAATLTSGFSAKSPKIVFLAGEYEYHSKESLPVFARGLEQKYDLHTIVLERPDETNRQTIPGLEALADADLMVVMVRRMTLPPAELEKIKDYVKSGRPIVGIRTASHAWQNWKEWDHEVLGGNYQNHRGNKLKTTVSIVPGAEDDPILKGVTGFLSDGSLYRNTPLQEGSKPLLMGRVTGFPPEPVAWTRETHGARVFYTSLGHPNDFKQPAFQHLLTNGILWALNRPVGAKERP
jgi:type 1 glutamine amidotransferase